MIYKYLAPSSRSLENLTRRQVIARHYTDFNDPFEFWARVRSGVPDREQDRERYLEAIRVWGGDEELEKETPEFFESLADGQPDFNILYDYTRIACFASNPTNLLMWSHYADGLRGLCVGFDENELSNSSDSYLATVRYSDGPPVVDSFIYAVAEDQRDYHRMALAEHRGPEPDPYAAAYVEAEQKAHALLVRIWESAFAAKPAQWAYEQEKRLLIRTKDGGTAPTFLVYPPEAVCEVVVGERMLPPYRAEIESALRAADVRIGLRTAVRMTEAYEVQIV
jgi:hypothetical protein